MSSISCGFGLARIVISLLISLIQICWRLPRVLEDCFSQIAKLGASWPRAVSLIYENDTPGLISSGLFFQPAKSSDDHQVTNLHQARGSTVNADFARASGQTQGVGFEPFSVLHIPDMNGLSLNTSGQL